jgi:hypothetical protein
MPIFQETYKMRRRPMLVFFIVASNIMAYGQLINDSTSGSFESTVSIYEYGDSLTSCETNFENLFRNWRNGYIANASQYSRFGSYSFVETISDSARYRYYRNYFSGLEVVSFYYSISGSSSYDGKQWNNKQEYFVAPFKYKWALLDGLPIETMVKIIELFNSEINIDTIELNTVSQEFITTMQEKQDGDFSYNINKRIVARSIWAYSDSATKESIDSMILRQVPFEDLDEQTQETLLSSQSLLMRVGMQKDFNKAVHIGDKVYVVPFWFSGLKFRIFVICNPISKKVVMDYFFKNIKYCP